MRAAGAMRWGVAQSAYVLSRPFSFASLSFFFTHGWPHFDSHACMGGLQSGSAGTARCGRPPLQTSMTRAEAIACGNTRLQSCACCLTLALILVQVSHKRKSGNLTEHSAEGNAPVVPVTEDPGAQEGQERSLKVSKVSRDSTFLCCTLQCSAMVLKGC